MRRFSSGLEKTIQQQERRIIQSKRGRRNIEEGKEETVKNDSFQNRTQRLTIEEPLIQSRIGTMKRVSVSAQNGQTPDFIHSSQTESEVPLQKSLSQAPDKLSTVKQ